MISRNADIIAIAILLAVIALYAQARDMMLIRVVPQQGITLASDFCQHLVLFRYGPSATSLRLPFVSN